MPKGIDGLQSAWVQYTLKTERRANLQAKINEAPTMVYYPKPMHFRAPYAPYGGGEGSLPVSETVCEQIMSLPMHPCLADEDARRIAQSAALWPEGSPPRPERRHP